MPKFYHYPKCSTCRNAEKWLKKRGVALEAVDITQSPPSKEQLMRILDASGKQAKDLLNTSGEQYRLLNLKDKVKTLGRDELLDLLSQNGRLIKRPLVFEGKKATIGFKEDEFNQIWV